MTRTITPQELDALRSQQEVELIDVRTPVEFREVHVEFARNVPLDRLDPQQVAAERSCDTSQPLYVICRSGNRAKSACDKLAAAGFNVVNVEGGTQAWAAAGLPVVRGKKAVSLERQVRMVVGAGVLTASLLAIFIHPYWAALAAFFGGGLLFAGITDFCGMALLLGRMPWNQVRNEGAASRASCCSVNRTRVTNA